jgi:hypothetical protein
VNDEGASIPLRAVWMFVLPLAAVLVIAYVYLRSENRDLEMKSAAKEEKMAALEGEVYRLKGDLEQKKALINYLTNPQLERYPAISEDSLFIWLFYRQADSTWFAYPDLLPSVKDRFTLYIDEREVGSFQRVSDSLGLKKVGRAPKGDMARVVEEKGSEVNPDKRVFQAPL